VCASTASAKRRRLLAGASSAALSLAILLPAGSAFAQANAPVTTNQAGGAPATEAKPGTELGTVVVTGSRIQRRDYTSNSPIVTLTSQNLLQQSDLQIQDTLNKLPQFSPDQNLMGANAGDVQPTPTHSVGISTASLRGLGANRNLVLIDGRRGPPVNAQLVVDLNTIPTALIDRVETITGGASATYGADAIGGVVNFILQRNFHGVNLDVQYGLNQAGDGRQFSASAVFGTNFADDKGNITFSFERLVSDASRQQNHEFYRKGWADPNSGPTSFFTYGTYFTPNNFVTNGGQRVNGGNPSQNIVNQLFPNAGNRILGTNTYTNPPGSITVPNNSSFYTVGNTTYTGVNAGFGGTGVAGNYSVPIPLDNQEWANQNCLDAAHGNQLGTCLKSNATTGMIQAPLERYSFFANGHYDFSDWLTAEFQGNYSRTHNFTILTAPVSVIDGWNAFIPFNPTTDSPVMFAPGCSATTVCGVDATHPYGTTAATFTTNPNYVGPGQNDPRVGHPVPTGIGQLLMSRTNPNAPWDMGWLPNLDGPLPPRGLDTTNQVFQLTAGLRGKIPGSVDFVKDWTWSAFGTHSESYEYDVSTGDYSLQRLRALLLAPGWGQTAPGAFIGGGIGNSTQPSGATVPGGIGTIPTTNPGFGVATATCGSGMYNLLFNGNKPSNDCLNAIAATLQSMNITKQDNVEFDLQGTIWKLPAGDMKFALGADYRRDQTVFNPDILQSYDSFIDQVVGVYAAPYTNVAEDVKEGYGELDIPILADLPFVKSFSINPGARYSTYSGSKGGWTYKIMGDYAMNDWLRFRGGYNLAVRAPNLGELFQGKTQFFGGPGTSYGDACSLLSNAPYGAGGARAPASGPAGAVTNAGGLAGAQSAYLICRAMMGTAAPVFYDDPTVTQPAPAPAGFGFINQIGNPNLIPEEAHTYTAGLVLRSPIQNDWLRNLTISVDYYKIHIDHAIEFATIDYTYQNCLQTTSVTTAAQAAAWVASNPYCQADTGVFRSSTGGMGSTNTPEANLSTIDTSGVDLTVDWRAPLSLAWKSLPGTVSVSVNGTFLGNYDTINFPGAPVSRWYNTLGPTLQGTNPGAFRYRLNTSFGYAIGPANISLNWRHLPQVNTNVPNGTPGVRTLPTSGSDIFDLNGFFNLPHGLQLRAGISNLFDRAPPTTAATVPLAIGGQTIVLGTSGAGTTNSSYYDVLGRRFYVGLKARF
jgi:outer membrane receptor protein involved in Fe transport